ncbi:nucleoside kinase [Clostridiaceae bacterium HSG29]|nr:nucleoside kinase [Clostridiaceae bacterium HSG29]
MKINIEDFGTVSIDKCISLEELLKIYPRNDKPITVAALVNNKLKELTYEISENDTIKFIDLSSTDGKRIYQRSISYLLVRSLHEIFADINIKLNHSLSKGLFFEVDFDRPLNEQDILVVKKKMQEIVNKDEPFIKIQMSLDDAKKVFNHFNMQFTKELMEYRDIDYINLYQSDWMKKYFFGYMVPSTRYLKLFDIMLYDNGIILRHPTISSPFEIPKFAESPRIAKVFQEYEKWAEIMNCNYVSKLNDYIKKNSHKDLIQVAEIFQEKKIAEIADMITKEEKRVILIAGPSSSGKTTFANRLRIQLMANGLKPVTLSTDDYFVERIETPLDEHGEPDFESIDALDLDLFNTQLKEILQGEKVSLPEFNFKIGTKEYKGKEMQIERHQPIIIEGIHGLNPKLTFDIFEKDKFKIYISALTQLNIDRHNRIPTTDARLIRRIVRDNNYRGNNASVTLNQWASVRRGEEKNIFPFQEDSDVVFNSAIIYELAVMKKHVEPLLKEIDINDKMYMEAIRLLKFLQYFEVIEDDSLIPNNSILKEFIGGSIFR